MYGHVRENQFVVTDLQYKVALQTQERIKLKRKKVRTSNKVISYKYSYIYT